MAGTKEGFIPVFVLFFGMVCLFLHDRKVQDGRQDRMRNLTLEVELDQREEIHLLQQLQKSMSQLKKDQETTTRIHLDLGKSYSELSQLNNALLDVERKFSKENHDLQMIIKEEADIRNKVLFCIEHHNNDTEALTDLYTEISGLRDRRESLADTIHDLQRKVENEEARPAVETETPVPEVMTPAPKPKKKVKKLKATTAAPQDEQGDMDQNKDEGPAVVHHKTNKELQKSGVWQIQFEVANLDGEPGTDHKGSFVMEIHDDWAPLGAARMKELVDSNFFTGVRFFRVIKGFMAQFGISGTPALAAKWRSKLMKDDPVKESNKRGYVSFATSGKDSRTTQLFINFGNNANLDGMGFSPFAKVVSGMEVVDRIFNIGEKPNQGQVQSEGNKYLKREFPQLTYITSATVVSGDDGAVHHEEEDDHKKKDHAGHEGEEDTEAPKKVVKKKVKKVSEAPATEHAADEDLGDA